MVWNSNLASWFGGSTRARELNATREAWHRSERAVASSPIARSGREDAVGGLALEITKESWERAPSTPVKTIALATGRVVADLLDAEAIGIINPLWDRIEGDVSVAIEFREDVAHRTRYANEFHTLHGTFRKQVLQALDAFYEALPPSAFDESAVDEGTFDVPLIELLQNPARLIQQFIAFAFGGDAIDQGLFRELRGYLKRNVFAASGLSMDEHAAERLNRLVYPLAQSEKPVADLADEYLAGTPMRELLDVPVPFHIPEEVRFEHCHVLGGTGHGKTQLLQRMIHSDLVLAQRERRSVVVIDSQGDLISRLSRLALFDPSARRSLAERIVLIDPADIEFPPALNLFDAHLDRLDSYSRVDRERVLNGVVETYESFFGDLLGAELTSKQGVVFKYLARLMLSIPGATIHTLMHVMEEPGPYRGYMRALEGSARYFFEREFFEPSFSQTKRQIVRRLWGVLSTPAFERMFAQRENKLDLFSAFDEGKIILVNTAKDLLREEGSSLLGRFFIGQIAQAALERATVAPDERTPVHVYVDEAQEYFDDRVETILTQARKYRVGLTLAHQTLDQLSPRLRGALYANTSVKLAGGTSSRDASALAHELHTSAEFIESMQRHKDRTEFALWIRNQTPNAIRLRVPLGFLERQPVAGEGALERLRELSRERYCGTLDDVEVAMAQFRGAPEPEQRADNPPRGPERPKESPEREPLQECTETAGPQRDCATLPQAPKRPPEQGKGGKQHRYLQHLIKQLAEERGLRVVIEEAVTGGQVDVGLHQGELSVACEISVTSTPEYETQNIAKCLQSGFVWVWAIAPDGKRKRAIEKRVAERLGTQAAGKVKFFTPEEVVEALDALVVPEPVEKVVKGYRVKSNRVAVSAEEAGRRRADLARIFSQRAGQ